jgi:hypothetical protein
MDRLTILMEHKVYFPEPQSNSINMETCQVYG